MNSAEDFDRAAHRRRFSFYYERAHPREIAAADLVGQMKGPVTILLNAQSDGKSLPEGIPALLVNNVEAGFTLAVAAVRQSPTFAALSSAERAEFETDLFKISIQC